MSKYRFPPRERELPIRQRASMKATFPQFGWRVTRSHGLEWNGPLQPTDESPVYHVRVVHNPNRSPKAFVVRPAIAKGAPHRYGDGSLCLYWPVEWQWKPSELLAETIIPWTALWLYYYELWLVTREWLGPSSPHNVHSPKEAA